MNRMTAVKSIDCSYSIHMWYLFVLPAAPTAGTCQLRVNRRPGNRHGRFIFIAKIRKQDMYGSRYSSTIFGSILIQSKCDRDLVEKICNVFSCFGRFPSSLVHPIRQSRDVHCTKDFDQVSLHYCSSTLYIGLKSEQKYTFDFIVRIFNAHTAIQ